MAHERKKIEDHGYKNFLFLNHENKLVRFEESKIVKS